MLSGSATGGIALIPSAVAAQTIGLSLGSLYLAQTDRAGTPNVLGLWVTATSLTAGQQVLIVCYNVSATTGLPTTRAWVQALTVGTSTNFVSVGSLSQAIPLGAWIGVQNPSSNAGTVTVSAAQPVSGGVFVGGLHRYSLLASSQGATTSSDVSAYTYSTSAAATVFTSQQTTPQVIGRFT